MTDSPSPQSTPAAQSPEQIARTTRYTGYTVFRRLSGLAEDGEITPGQVTAELGDAVRLIEDLRQRDADMDGDVRSLLRQLET